MTPPIFRHKTWDYDIWHSIITHNEYQIHDNWNGSIIDVGGHIGSFSYFMLSHRGASSSIIVEPDPHNFLILQHNLSDFINSNKVTAINAGIGSPNSKLQPCSGPHANTGGTNYGESPDGTIDSVTLDHLINMGPEGPILLKLDCEGCEYTALSNCENMSRISAIVGEYHERDSYHHSTLEKFLHDYGFSSNYHYTSDSIGLFGAHRPNPYGT